MNNIDRRNQKDMLNLSILIPTTSARSEIQKGLLADLDRQMKVANVNGHVVELIINAHETDIIGKKRNDLLKEARGQYIVFVDSDDLVSSDYIEKILRAAETRPDCIGISGVITQNGCSNDWHISRAFGSWYERDGVYYRTPNHISPVRRELALKAGFLEIAFGEDHGYSVRLLPHLKTEVKIPGILYYYRYDGQKMHS